MILHKLLAQLAPYDCLGCRAEGALICSACTPNLLSVPERCYRCRTLRSGSRTCPSCRTSSELYSVRPRTPYGGLAKELVWRLKFSGAQAAAQEMALLMRDLVPTGDILLVPVPTATTRVRKRGYDQSQLLARALSRQTGQPYYPALRRLGQHHQVGATRGQRITQLQDAYRCIRPHLIQDAHIILIDDVLTTGATLEAAAKVLKAAGATRVSAMVFAQA